MTSTEMQDLGSDLTLYAARLVRLLRRERPQPAGLRVLSILDETGPLGVTPLAAVDQCSQPTMTGIVNGLVERGWVRKQPDRDDGRSNLVALTAAGRKVLADTRRANGELVAARLAASGTRVQDLTNAVDLLRTILEPDKEVIPQ